MCLFICMLHTAYIYPSPFAMWSLPVVTWDQVTKDRCLSMVWFGRSHGWRPHGDIGWYARCKHGVYLHTIIVLMITMREGPKWPMGLLISECSYVMCIMKYIDVICDMFVFRHTYIARVKWKLPQGHIVQVLSLLGLLSQQRFNTPLVDHIHLPVDVDITWRLHVCLSLLLTQRMAQWPSELVYFWI